MLKHSVKILVCRSVNTSFVGGLAETPLRRTSASPCPKATACRKVGFEARSPTGSRELSIDFLASTLQPSFRSDQIYAIMKVRLLQTLFSLTLISSSWAEEQHKLNTVEDALAEGADSNINSGAAAGATNSEAISDTATTFNGVKVPPMKELTGKNFEEETKHGHW